MQTKICSRCKKELPISKFPKHKRSRDGLGAWCKECHREYNKVYQRTHRKESCRRVRKWRRRNKEKINRRIRESYDPQKRRERYMRNRETELARQREYNQRPEVKVRHREQQRLWISRNRELKREYWRQYNARKQGADGSHSTDEWLSICKKCGWLCAACGIAHTEDNPLTMDHIVPLSKGGTDYIDNIQPLCRKCNSKKGTRTINYL